MAVAKIVANFDGVARAKSKERFKIVQHRNASGTVSWRVSGTDASGKQIRKNFAHHVDAQDCKFELEAEYHGHSKTKALQKTRLTPEQVSDAEAALDSCRGKARIRILVRQGSFSSMLEFY